jgi:hypothetical protein
MTSTTLFNAAVPCAYFLLQYTLLPQMKQEGKRYKKIKTYRPFRNAKYVDGFTVKCQSCLKMSSNE